jgi:hypothetical protein
MREFEAVDKFLHAEYVANEGCPAGQLLITAEYKAMQPEYAARSAWLASAEYLVKQALAETQESLANSDF